MNSLEAIKKLTNYLDLSLDSQDEAQATKLINTIKKDLEVLEIIKKVFNYRSVQKFVDHMTKDEFLTVQEWLENDNK
jgi:hypothetical protein